MAFCAGAVCMIKWSTPSSQLALATLGLGQPVPEREPTYRPDLLPAQPD
jgi:hypothetical protein